MEPSLWDIDKPKDNDKETQEVINIENLDLAPNTNKGVKDSGVKSLEEQRKNI